MINNSVLSKYSFNVKTVLFEIIQFSISTQFKCEYGLIVKKHFYLKLFRLVKTIQFNINIRLVLFNP